MVAAEKISPCVLLVHTRWGTCLLLQETLRVALAAAAAIAFSGKYSNCAMLLDHHQCRVYLPACGVHDFCFRVECFGATQRQVGWCIPWLSRHYYRMSLVRELPHFLMSETLLLSA